MFKKTETGTGCPLLGMKPCAESQCSWWIEIRGKHPQTEEDMNHWGCSIAWMPILQIENSQQTRQAGAAVESLRNNVARAQERLSHRSPALVKPRA